MFKFYFEKECELYTIKHPEYSFNDVIKILNIKEEYDNIEKKYNGSNNEYNDFEECKKAVSELNNIKIKNFMTIIKVKDKYLLTYANNKDLWYNINMITIFDNSVDLYNLDKEYDIVMEGNNIYFNSKEEGERFLKYFNTIKFINKIC